MIGITGAAGSGKCTLVTALARELRDARQDRRHRRGRPVEPVHRRLDPRRPHPHAGARAGPGRLHPLHGHARRARRARAGDARRRRRPRRGGLRRRDHRDRRRRPGRGRHRAGRAHGRVVSVPGMGDDIQAIKAGLLEIADIHVVNKADRPDTDRTITELQHAQPGARRRWELPSCRPSRRDGTGVAELADAFDAHRAWLADSGELARRERRAPPPAWPPSPQDLLLEELESPSSGDAFERAVDDVQTAAPIPDRRARPDPSRSHEGVPRMSTVPTTPRARGAPPPRRGGARELGGRRAGRVPRAPRRVQGAASSPAPATRSSASTAPSTWPTPPGRTSACRAAFPTRAGPTRRCTARALDDAPDRGLRHAAGHQRALPVPDRAGPDRHLDRLRHADPDGLRLRRPDVRSARSGARASRSTCSTTWRRSSTASTSRRSRCR